MAAEAVGQTDDLSVLQEFYELEIVHFWSAVFQNGELGKDQKEGLLVLGKVFGKGGLGVLRGLSQGSFSALFSTGASTGIVIF